MARDYKRRTSSRRKKKKRSPSPWRYTLTGFLLGAVVAVVVYRMALPPPLEPAGPVPAVVVEPPSALEPEPAPVRRPRPQPEQDDRFTFYDLLPKFEVVIPESEEPIPDDAPAAPVSTPGAYVLQAGSFQSFSDADRMKAMLALQGVESRIQKVTIDDKTWHRVRIGPVTELDNVNDLRTRLRMADIDVLLLRVGQ